MKNIKEKINRVNVKFEKLLKKENFNWALRMTFITSSLIFMLLPIVMFFDLIYLSFKHTGFIDEHFNKWILVILITTIISILFLLLSKLFYKLYFRIKKYTQTD